MNHLSIIKSTIPEILIDLKYAGTDNFAGKPFYLPSFEAMLAMDALKSLEKANEYLKNISPECNFVIWDAARPHSVQVALFEEVKNTEKEKYIAHPVAGSLHNYACAVDIGIIDEKGNILDMGTEYDHFGELAEPSKEIEMLHIGQLSQQALSNRLLLRHVMVKAGFQPIPHEWWHFNFCSLEMAKQKYPLF